MTFDKRTKISPVLQPPLARRADEKRKKGFGFKIFGRKKNDNTSTEPYSTDDEASSSCPLTPRRLVPSVTVASGEENPGSGHLDVQLPETLQAVRKSLQTLAAEVHNDSKRLTSLLGKSLGLTRTSGLSKNSPHFLPSAEELREIKRSIQLLVEEVSCENKHIKAALREALTEHKQRVPPRISIKSASDPSRSECCSSEPPSVATTAAATADDDDEDDPPSLHSFLMDSSVVSSNVDNSCRHTNLPDTLDEIKRSLRSLVREVHCDNMELTSMLQNSFCAQSSPCKSMTETCPPPDELGEIKKTIQELTTEVQAENKNIKMAIQDKLGCEPQSECPPGTSQSQTCPQECSPSACQPRTCLRPCPPPACEPKPCLPPCPPQCCPQHCLPPCPAPPPPPPPDPSPEIEAIERGLADIRASLACLSCGVKMGVRPPPPPPPCPTDPAVLRSLDDVSRSVQYLTEGFQELCRRRQSEEAKKLAQSDMATMQALEELKSSMRNLAEDFHDIVKQQNEEVRCPEPACPPPPPSPNPVDLMMALEEIKATVAVIGNGLQQSDAYRTRYSSDEAEKDGQPGYPVIMEALEVMRESIKALNKEEPPLPLPPPPEPPRSNNREVINELAEIRRSLGALEYQKKTPPEPGVLPVAILNMDKHGRTGLMSPFQVRDAGGKSASSESSDESDSESPRPRRRCRRASKCKFKKRKCCKNQCRLDRQQNCNVMEDIDRKQLQCKMSKMNDRECKQLARILDVLDGGEEIDREDEEILREIKRSQQGFPDCGLQDAMGVPPTAWRQSVAPPMQPPPPIPMMPRWYPSMPPMPMPMPGSFAPNSGMPKSFMLSFAEGGKE
ncbi:hypothetical protein AAHC03_024221 [Spirometra sp. Aus1]